MTATIAATPIATPSADSPAYSLRVRSPMLASPARSPGPQPGRAWLCGHRLRPAHGTTQVRLR
jgi:hypothetical protein